MRRILMAAAASLAVFPPPAATELSRQDIQWLIRVTFSADC